MRSLAVNSGFNGIKYQRLLEQITNNAKESRLNPRQNESRRQTESYFGSCGMDQERRSAQHEKLPGKI